MYHARIPKYLSATERLTILSSVLARQTSRRLLHLPIPSVIAMIWSAIVSNVLMRQRLCRLETRPHSVLAECGDMAACSQNQIARAPTPAHAACSQNKDHTGHYTCSRSSIRTQYMQIDQSAHAVCSQNMFMSHPRARRWHGLRLRQIDQSAHTLGVLAAMYASPMVRARTGYGLRDRDG